MGTPRLMIPITAVILFEYFLMDLGATRYLEYIPSITWSTWPSTEVYNNFGWFINETLQTIRLLRFRHHQSLVWAILGLLLLVRTHDGGSGHHVQIPQVHPVALVGALPDDDFSKHPRLCLPGQRPA